MKPLLLMLGLAAAISQESSAQAARPQDLFLTRWHPPQGQGCEVLEQPVPLPAAVFDTARLYQRLAGLAGGSIVLAWAPPDTAWREDFGPRRDSLAVVEATLPDTVAREIRDAALATLNRPVVMPVLLRIDLVNRPVLRLAPALVCRPAVRNGVELESFNERLRTLGSGPRLASVGLVVRPDGSVAAPRLRTSSGDPRFDAVAVDAVSALRFHPGLLNRVPIAVLVAFPVEVR